VRNVVRAVLLIPLLALLLASGCRQAQDTAPPKTPPPEAERSASGLASVIQRAGTGDARAQPHDKVRVAFTAWNEKGKLVDSSDKRGGPVVFDLAGVITGWQEALQAMRVGEQRRIWVPDDLGYPGRPGYPRGNAVFDLELLEIIAGEPPLPAPPDVAAAPADAITTSSGLAYKWLAKGSSQDTTRAWDRVTIHYAGWTADGAMIERSPNERPSVFDVPKVIPGWREALLLMSAGDRARVWLPEALAYRGAANKPSGALVFELELIAIDRKPEPPRAPADVAAAPPDAKKTASGLAYRVLRRGHGKSKPEPGDRVEVHYSAWTTDGTLFDSSLARGKPATLPLDRLIPGWAEGLALLSEGDKAIFWIPEPLAYRGQAGAPQGALVYEVELLRIAQSR
jgi:FKBP-type peptidyl-prolyl cis-trans isomerase